MTTPLGRLTEDELREHAPWLRRVARGLVAGEAEAQDLAQDVWIELARASGPIAHLRALSARIARRLAGHRRQAQLARGRREARAARDEALPGPDELQSALDMQRLLLEELSALDEIHRTPLVLHYYEELSAAEIARRRGVPASTVRGQIRRGLAELRERLDRRHGGERALWTALVARLPRHEAMACGAVAGGLTLAALGKALLVAGVVGVMAVAWRVALRSEELARPDRADAVAPAGVTLAEPSVSSPESLAVPEAESAPRAARVVEPRPVEGTLDVPVLVLDEESAQPLHEFVLELWREGDAEATELSTDAAGRATIESRWFEAPFQLQLEGDRERSFEDEARELGPEHRPEGGEPLVLTCAAGPSYTLLLDSPAPYDADLVACLSGGSDPAVDPTFAFKASLHRDGARVWTRFAPTRDSRSQFGDGPWTLTVLAKDGLWRAHGPVTTIEGEQREPVRLTAELCGALRLELEPDGAPELGDFALSLYRVIEGAGVEPRHDWIPAYRRAHVFGHLAAGEYQVRASSPVHESAGQRVRVVAGVTEKVTLALERKPGLAELRVVITSESGRLQLPLIGAMARELTTNVWKNSEYSPESTSTRRVLLFEGLARSEHEVTLSGGGLGSLGTLAFAPGRSQTAVPGGDELVFTGLDAGAPPQRTGRVRVLSRAGEPLRNAGVTTYFDGWGSFQHETDADGTIELESIVEGVRFELLVLADGFRPVFVRDLALPFDGDEIEVRLDPGWGAWLDVVLSDPRAAPSTPRPARAAGGGVLVDGEPAGELDERGQILLSGDAAPERIEIRYPGHHVAYGHVDAETGAPIPHYTGPLWIVLEPDGASDRR